jgi:endonuclease G, mitochondrial
LNFDRLLCHLGATALVALGVCAADPAHAQSCNCEATPAQERAADALLSLTPAQRTTSAATHLPFGVPVTAGATNETLLYTREYALNHDADLRTATWVGYRLTAADALARRARTDCFRRDLRLPVNQSSVCEDYVEPIFDRGHLVPNGDMQRSLNAQLNTFVLSNMAPQFNPFNGGIWATLEQYVRDWAVDRDPLFVVSGAIFDENGDGRRDADAAVRRVQDTRQGTERLGIATDFYKILLHQRADGFIEVMALVLPHNQERIGTGRVADEYLRARLTTIDDIEARTGINYLPGLEQTEPARARAVERSRATALWPHN